MRKYIKFSAIALGLIGSVNTQAADDISGMFSEGKVSGQIREFSISRSVDSSAGTDYTRTANAIGGYIKYETASLNGLSLGTAFYTTNGFLNDSQKTNSTVVDPTLFGDNSESYSILGEAYLQYKYGNTTFKIGRQKLDTPMAGSDDARMIPNLFEAYTLINTDIKNTTIVLSHVNKFAQGTFGRAYNASKDPANSILSATAGYSAVDSLTRAGEFVNMGEYAVGTNTSGVTVGGVIYKDGDFKAQVWDYYAHDILNAIYADASISWDCMITKDVKPFASIQYINENEVGDDLAGEINGNYWSAKFGAKYDNFSAYLAYSDTSSNSSTDFTAGNFGANAIISPWGGMPAFTQGMVTRHVFLAGTEAIKVAGTYNFKDMGADIKATLYHAKFDMDVNNGYTVGDVKETGFDIIYNDAFTKNLQLRVRANYTDDFNVNATTGATVGWDEYRFIANYKF
jgi:hypothetical protein